MAASTAAGGVPKRAWKLQEFVAHGASVNCVSLGHKSGRVLVTGGDDKKVNLWAVGKPNCIMGLVGHTTPIECVRFGQTEELVVAGSASGALKIWDLEAAKLLKTLTGHKAGLTCADFHPYGDFLASGSADKTIKLWDVRRKGCIFTYKGHANRVNSIKFSPDGQWIASAGEDAAVRIWDLRAGKLMTEFSDHDGPVYDVEFHPHEFLLASSSQDRTVNFWDLEAFTKISNSDKDTGPIRTIVFHPEGNALFSGSHDMLKIHQWEPGPRVCDAVSMGWGKIRDMAVSASQLIGVAYNMSNVSLYVVDLARTSPFNGIPVAESVVGFYRGSAAATNPSTASSSNLNPPSDPAASRMRRSFVKDKSKPCAVKEETNSDPNSGTDPEDSDAGAKGGQVINDVANYKNIFRPRNRELNRTPPPPDEPQPLSFNEPFQAPLSGSESEQNLARPTDLRLKSVATASGKRLSPSPSRRQSQPMPPSGSQFGSPVRVRKGSQPGTPTGDTTRPKSFHPTPSSDNAAPPTLSSAPGSNTNIYQRPEVDIANAPEYSTPLNPVSRIQISGSQPHLVQQPQQQQHPPPASGGGCGRPLDRPVHHRPVRTSVNIPPPSAGHPAGDHHSPPVSDKQHINLAGSGCDPPIDPANPFPVMYPTGDPYMVTQPSSLTTTPSHGPSSRKVSAPAAPPSGGELTLAQLRARAGNSQYIGAKSAGNLAGNPSALMPPPAPPTPLPQPPPVAASPHPPISPEKKGLEVIPMNADKPTGLQMDEFLPKKFSGLGLNYNTMDDGGGSKYSSYKNYSSGGGDLSETEVTSSMLKGHDGMMAVLTTRGRNMEIIQKLWQSKDAKAAVDQAVSLNDQAIMVDFLSVISLRPSIWNLDLCESLLPTCNELLQSKYEMYINVGCGATKLILKNFASVIKSNIDSPVQTVGVDISREERHRKCMQCYKDLVKIRALIIKRQSMQGKLGHTFRELAILMQYLD